MGKSIRSKTKRAFRAKKREDSVYAAVHAARLNRLHKKLMDITLTDADGDAEIEEVSEFEDEKDGSGMQGRYRCRSAYLLLGLVDPDDITSEERSMPHAYGGSARVSRLRIGSDTSGLDAPDFFPQFFASE